MPLLIALALLLIHGDSCANSAPSQTPSSAQSAAPPEQLTPETQAWLRTTIQTGNLADLRWPDFSDYTKLLQEFYGSYGYALPWVRGLQPTPQAQQIIALLFQADQKGLNAEDYDASRWADRLAKLRPGTPQPSEADAARFDVALTVCIMRYISDLHIGKVNPKHFEFDINVNVKKYDLPEFLKTNVVNASDVASVLAQV
ncbi:MAG: hypothetical protein WBQ31_04950, partial [Candidatus Acidiferrales bacterium]